MTAAEITVAETSSACRTLGPGVRYVLWVQGCPLSCPGCVSPQWLSFTGGTRVPVPALAAEIVRTARDGLTISGGEPFSQAPALAALIAEIRRQRDLSVMCYTGHTLAHLRRSRDPAVHELLGSLDLLVDGPYIAARHGDLRWRGSDNQRLHALTDRHAEELTGPDTSAGLDFAIRTDGTLQWQGVPAVPHFKNRFEAALDIVAPGEDKDR
ncbi:4Fe-4S single cluster domain-containing protein [Nocardia sp. NPDC059240]|uniref:4Fe-4S single cluster domain-containing protein n=1 Tax=Nocardia sp. NPDC059240 TaxID=3346786 RepID=UPI0036ADD5E1